MKKQNFINFKDIEHALASPLIKVHDYIQKCIEANLQLGLCTVCPKNNSIQPPSEAIQAELQQRATEYFQSTAVHGYYFKCWTPPIMPKTKDLVSNSADDYHMIFQLPSFDTEWQTSTLARGIIYCPSEKEEGEWHDWFELQSDETRLTPLLHHIIKECEIISKIHKHLEQQGFSEFEGFIYEYGIDDDHLKKMTGPELENWKKKNTDWRERYPLLDNLFDPSSTLRDIYVEARKKAASSRNLMLKDLLWAFTKSIEDKLIRKTELTETKKQQQLEQLAKIKKRTANKERYNAKRPTVCISDVECGKVLYFLINTFLEV